MVTIALMTLANRLKQCRESVEGLSARALSDLAGLSSSMVSYIERGKRAESVEARTLVALGTVLGTTAEWLLLGDGPAPSPRRIRSAVERAKSIREAA